MNRNSYPSLIKPKAIRATKTIRITHSVECLEEKAGESCPRPITNDNELDQLLERQMISQINAREELENYTIERHSLYYFRPPSTRPINPFLLEFSQ